MYIKLLSGPTEKPGAGMFRGGGQGLSNFGPKYRVRAHSDSVGSYVNLRIDLETSTK